MEKLNMTTFNLDFNDTFEGTGNTKVKDGFYEVFVNGVKEDATPNGAEYVELDLIIRNDVMGNEHQNSHLFHKIWKTKATGKYNMKTFNTLGKAFKLQNGKQYNSFDELLNDFVNKVAETKVLNETSESNGKTYDNTNCKFFNESKFPSLAHIKKTKDNTSVADMQKDNIEIKEDDLPF